jgi:integrase
VDTTTLKGTRDLAILDLMLYLGLRREEVMQLTLADLRQDGGRWWLFVAGKGQKTRRLKVHDDLYRSLWAWFGQSGCERPRLWQRPPRRWYPAGT